MKSFTDAYIRRLNDICDEFEHCDRSCLGMGWCSTVYETEMMRCEGDNRHTHGARGSRDDTGRGGAG